MYIYVYIIYIFLWWVKLTKPSLKVTGQIGKGRHPKYYKKRFHDFAEKLTQACECIHGSLFIGCVLLVVTQPL
jgi:uncharacterized membrane protein